MIAKRLLFLNSITIFFFLYTPGFSQFTEKNVTNNNSSLSDIYMVSSAVGYAGGVDGIFKTTDGCMTWSLTPYFASNNQLPDYLVYKEMNDHHLRFINENIGYSVGWGASGNYEQIVKTTDGGKYVATSTP